MPEQEGHGPAPTDREFSESERTNPAGVQEWETAPAPELLLLPEIRTYTPGERLELLGDNGEPEKYQVVSSNAEAEEVFLQRVNSQDKLRLEVFSPLELGLEMQSRPLANQANEILTKILKDRSRLKGLNIDANTLAQLVEAKRGSFVRSAALEIFYNHEIPPAKKAEAVRVTLERYVDGLNAKRQLHELTKAEAYARHIENLAKSHYPEPGQQNPNTNFDQVVESTVAVLRSGDNLNHTVADIDAKVWQHLFEVDPNTSPTEDMSSEPAEQPFNTDFDHDDPTEISKASNERLAKLRQAQEKRKVKPELPMPMSEKVAREKSLKAWQALKSAAFTAKRLFHLTDPSSAKALEIYHGLTLAFEEAKRASVQAELAHVYEQGSEPEYQEWLALLNKYAETLAVSNFKKMKAKQAEPKPKGSPTPEPKPTPPGTWLGHMIDSFEEKTKDLIWGKK